MKHLVAAGIICAMAWGTGWAAAARALFVIERSKNANVVVYEARFDDTGTFAAQAPIAAYWQLNATTGGTEPLSMLDKKAYGFTVKQEQGRYVMRLAPFRQRPIEVVGDGARGAQAQMNIGGTPSRLTKIFVQAPDGNIIPKVAYVDLFGTALAGGTTTYERILP